jgi:flagellar hook-length control protein FliK
MEPRRSEKGNMLSQAGGDAVKGEERAGTAHITQSGSGSADHGSSGNGHEKSAFLIDFNSANHKSAHRGFSLQTAEGHPGQSATHTATSEFTALRTGSVYGNETKITPPSDSVRAGVLDQVGQGISTAMAMNRNRAVIHLNPPELGSVTIRLHVDHNNHVRASFMAEHVHTHQLIESGMESLKSQLAQNGFDLGQVNVNLAGGGMHDPGSSRRHETGTGGKGFENTIKEDDGEAVLDASASGHGIHDQGNGVHIIM